MDKKNIILCIVIIILIALSMLLFFGTGTTSKTEIQISSFIFIIITELLVFGKIMFIVNKKLDTFTIAGLSSTAFIYMICSLLFNALLLNVFHSVKSVLIFNCSALLIYAFIDLLIMLFKNEVN